MLRFILQSYFSSNILKMASNNTPTDDVDDRKKKLRPRKTVRFAVDEEIRTQVEGKKSERRQAEVQKRSGFDAICALIEKEVAEDVLLKYVSITNYHRLFNFQA